MKSKMKREEKSQGCPYREDCVYANNLNHKFGVFLTEGYRKAWCDSTGRDYDSCPLNLYWPGHQSHESFIRVRSELWEIMEAEALA